MVENMSLSNIIGLISLFIAFLGLAFAVYTHFKKKRQSPSQSANAGSNSKLGQKMKNSKDGQQEASAGDFSEINQEMDK